jgi:hypothetical protein
MGGGYDVQVRRRGGLRRPVSEHCTTTPKPSGRSGGHGDVVPGQGILRGRPACPFPSPLAPDQCMATLARSNPPNGYPETKLPASDGVGGLFPVKPSC